MPGRVPRTEYSAEMHWDLLTEITGIAVTKDSPDALKAEARRILVRKWDYSFFWSTYIGHGEFPEYYTDMGHAEYMAGGVDLRQPKAGRIRTVEDVLGFRAMDALGPRDHATLVKRFEDHYRAQVAAGDDGVRMTGIYITLISGLLDLFGWDLLLEAAGTDPRAFGRVANGYAEWIQQYFDALAAADVPVVMVHDDMVWTSGPFIQPDWYREFVFPNYRKYIAPLRDSGKIVAFTSDGDYTMFLDDVVAAGAHGVAMEPMTDMAYFAAKYGRTHFFIGNADTRILLSGTKPQIRAEVERCMRIGKPCPGFILAVGNHIPPNTPVENALYYNEVYESLRRR
jgi:hypothetical protein